MTVQEFFNLYATIIKASKRIECEPNPYLNRYHYCVIWQSPTGSTAYTNGEGYYSIELCDGTEIDLHRNGRVTIYA